MWGKESKDPLKVRELNDRLMMAERAFADRDGLFERPWYKHLVSLFHVCLRNGMNDKASLEMMKCTIEEAKGWSGSCSSPSHFLLGMNIDST